MSELEQMIARPSANEATIAAIADVLAAIGSDGGAVEWADEQPIEPPASGTPVAASGATISHGPIRLRDSAPPSLSEDHPPVQQPVVVAAGEPVGHGAIRLCEPSEASEAPAPAPAPAPEDPTPAADAEATPAEPVGHGTIRLRGSDAAPLSAHVTPVAQADILDAIAATES